MDALTSRQIKAALDKRAATPAAANHVLRMLRLLMRYAVEAGWRPDDPTVGVRRLKEKAEGVATWTDADIEVYEAKWPTGSKERLALALLLYTGQRRSDVVRMGRQHLRGDRIEVRQVKTKTRLLLPLHQALQDELAQVPPGQMTFLQTTNGAAFTPEGFYNWFIERCRGAGLPAGLSPHGLRKAQARRLAEAGCTAHEIAAITGHKTLAEVQRYARAVEQAGLADAAMAKVVKRKTGT